MNKLNFYNNYKKIENFYFVVIFSSVVFLLVYNIFNYNIIYGYDASAHINYSKYLAMYLPQSFKLPLRSDTYEFFSPPLAYIFPSFVQVICRNLSSSSDLVSSCMPVTGKLVQIFQSILYLLTIYINMVTINKFFNNTQKKLNLNVLIMISLLTVNYKTISMLRGEPYIIFFLSIVLYLFLKISRTNFELNKVNLLSMGVCLGMMGISRQWALLIFPAFLIPLYYIKNKYRFNYLKFFTISFLIALIIIIPFFFHLYTNYGTITSFNKESMGFSFNNQPSSFYNPLNQDSLKIFTKPIRGNFDNQLLPILYSDLWGDYWGYFSFTSNYLEDGRNQMAIGDYLARVNIFSIFPTLLLLLGFINLRRTSEHQPFTKLIKSSIIFSFFGYLWFLVSYPEIPSGDTIKSTYMIQIFNLLALSSTIFLEQLKNKDIKKYFYLITLLIIVFFHNISAMMSHFGNIA